MNKRLRVGIIGAGGIAHGVHVPNYHKCGHLVEIVAVSDINRGRAEGFAHDFGILQVYDNYEDMLKYAELDAVSICTPNKFHEPAVIAALRAGCHVLCEKPPAMNVAEARRMQEEAEIAGRILTFGFHHRHSIEVGTMKTFADAGELGDIYAVRVKAMRRRGIPSWGVFTNKELQGGGPLIDIGVHMLDSALYIMGYPEPASVMGSTYTKLGNRKGFGFFGEWDWQNYNIEDMAMAMIKFKNGATLMLETSFAANIEPQELFQISLMGDQGGAEVYPLKIFQEKHETLVDLTPVLPNYPMSAHENQIRRFVDCCLNGSHPISTPAEGVILQSIVDAIYKSAETGDLVRL